MSDNADIKKLEPGTAIDLDQEFIVLAIPADTVELEITARVYIDHELYKVYRQMDFANVREAIREAKQGYIPSDAVFMLAPTREEKLRELIEKYAYRDDEEE